MKLAKKATKTKKAVSFSLDATAQTGLSVAKASGSSKITLKKDVKKGTYKAKATINAAATDAYYAAAKTVTVAFKATK